MEQKDTERVKRLEDKSSDWIFDFLNLNKGHNLPEELVQSCLDVLISRHGLCFVAISLRDKKIWHKAYLILPEGFENETLSEILDIIEAKPLVGNEERKILSTFLYRFPENLNEKLKRVLKKFLDSKDPEILQWLLCLRLGFEEIKKSVREKIIAGNNIELILRVLRFNELPSELEKEGIKKVIASKESVFIYYLLRNFDLPQHQKIQVIEALLSQKNYAYSYLILRNISNLPIDLQEEAIEIIRSKTKPKPKPKPKEITSLALKAIQQTLGPKWILMTYDLREQIKEIDKDSSPDWRFERIGDEIPVVQDTLWFLRDREQRVIGDKTMTTGALLWIDHHRHNFQVILLLDPSNFKGYAYQANPEAKTVAEALAYAFQLEPKKFKGFVEEK